MVEDFSWEASAREYVSLYRKALKAAGASTRTEP
jgi:glycogen synthase